jgi:Cu-processing system ATP-binding protein
MITIDNLTKSFGKLQVLKGISLEFKSQGIYTILGPNGSGKTTLIKCLLGMVIPDGGVITLGNNNIAGDWKYRNEISYLPQIARFPQNLKVYELLKMIKDLRFNSCNETELISMFKLEEFMDKKLRNLSGGTIQKINILITFMFNSPYLVLDEPTNGLDPVALLRFRELLREEKENGKIILISTHIMNFVEEISDSIVFLLDGSIYFQGTVDELKQKSENQNFELAIASILSQTYE